MRILHVARYGSIRGGAETYVRALCEGLRDAGHDVGLAYGLDGDASRAEVRDGYEIRALAGDTEPDEAALARAIGDFDADVVHVHLPDVPWTYRVAGERAPVLLAVPDHRLHCPAGTKYWTAWRAHCRVDPGPWCLGYNVVAHCGSLRANATLRPYRSWRASNRAARAVNVQVFSRWIRDRVVGAGIPPERVTITPYPVPPRARAVAPIDADGRPVVFASGRLNKEKGFHELIDALSRIRTPLHLVIGGDGHERDALEKRARTTPGPHRITFTGWLSEAEHGGWLARAALVAVPSMWPEPFGIVGLEAMDAAKPVVAFASGGIPEWLTDGETGKLVPAGDVLAFARALESLLQDAHERERMGEAGARVARERFSLVSHIERLVPLYDQIRREREGAA